MTALRADRIDRKMRGLMAIAITDAIHAHGLRPISPTLVGLRGFFRITIPRTVGEAARDVVSANRNRGTLLGCMVVVGALMLPFLLPIEIVRSLRVLRHNRRMLRAFAPLLPPAGGGYRDIPGADATLRRELLQADQVLAIDWTIRRDGTLCFAGTALGVVHGNDHSVRWLTVHRGPPPPSAMDASAVAKALSELSVVTTRWDWELEDPFEAVERS